MDRMMDRNSTREIRAQSQLEMSCVDIDQAVQARTVGVKPKTINLTNMQ